MKRFHVLVLQVIVLAFAVASAPLCASAGPQPADWHDHVPAPRDVPFPGTIRLAVDATDVAHGIFDVHETVPVTPGPFTLLFPEWIPGHHSPDGPIDKFAGLEMHANGKALAWMRDPGNVYAFHVDIPAGVDTLELHFQYLSPQRRDQLERTVMTPQMLNVQWNTVSLYPAGYFSRDITVEPSVKLPAGWQLGTALTVSERQGDLVRFEPIDYENLVDSPIFAGQYFKRIDLDPGSKTPVFLDVFADDPKYLEVTNEEIKLHREMVQQFYKLYGAHHYDHYDFLLALTDEMSHIGLEHHRSSEDGTVPDYFTKWDKAWYEHDLLTHEFNHSWDGKYRRPAQLWTPNYNVTKKDPGLWVYEGQTQYWGYVLAARSGMVTHEQIMEALGSLAGRYDRGRPGMAWRTILDTTNDPTIANRVPLSYRDYQMSEDYYSGGELIWFAVDAKLRRLTDDKRSLDDFARAFFGMHNGAWDVNTYTFDVVVATLNSLAEFNWRAFLTSRLEGHVNLAKGLEDEGWRVIYNDKPSIAEEVYEKRYHNKSFTYSLGVSVNDKGAIYSVAWDSPAFKAGLAPAMTLIAINGKEFSTERLEDAIVAAKKGTEPITFVVKDTDDVKTIQVDYHGGLQIPHLERIEGTPDYLSEVLAPRK